jgi:deoxyribose-phosphate aldolase
MSFTYEQVAKTIDHSLLNPCLTAADLDEGCALAVRYNVASVCILPYAVPRCAELLRGSTVLVSTTVGFPHGGHATSVKLAEARQALADGAVELDMVVNISRVLSDDLAYVAGEIRQVTELVHEAHGRLKIIFENCYLNAEQKVALCDICSQAGVDWVKTSTGYGSGGFTFEDIDLMLRHVSGRVQVKAAGGVRDLDTLLCLMSLGVTRCGATRTKTMLDEFRGREKTGAATAS